jgi:divalent metal cation (Fe/Co/Zn/Cd) transporter
MNIAPLCRRIKELVTGDELAIVRGIKSLMRRTPLTRRYLESREFRAEVSIYAGLAVNLMYSLMKGLSGVWYRSAWLISVGVYYLIFAVIRFMLAYSVRRSRRVPDKQSQWKAYRTCGVMMFLMNGAMAGMAVQMVVKNAAEQYSQTLVILSAAYTFYIFISAVVKVIQFRKLSSPVLSASKDLTLAGAVMSMYTLQTAMLAAFDEEERAGYRLRMNAITGAAVTVIVLTISVTMIINSSRRSAE